MRANLWPINMVSYRVYYPHPQLSGLQSILACTHVLLFVLFRFGFLFLVLAVVVSLCRRLLSVFHKQLARRRFW